MLKAGKILLQAIPILVMVGLIPMVANDYMLSALYLVISAIALRVGYEKHDLLLFIFGLVAMTVFESFFISTGVETFTRNSFIGLMPLWLLLLWGYGFVAIKRSVLIISH